MLKYRCIQVISREIINKVKNRLEISVKKITKSSVISVELKNSVRYIRSSLLTVSLYYSPVIFSDNNVDISGSFYFNPKMEIFE